ncbi:MAG: pyridoxine 5'-phosphate synthase [Pseudomarimonas sp.]
MTVLSVNVNKIAVLRNSRGGSEPDPVAAAHACIAAGCGGITVHPRPDGRHIRHADVLALRQLCRGRVEFNIEGNPFAPAREGYLGLIELVRLTRPEQCTLVPDGDGQLTSDHGFDVASSGHRLAPLIAQLRELDCRVSIFMDAGAAGLEQLKQLGADRIELYTGPYAHAHAEGMGRPAAHECAATALAAMRIGLGVNAGHDLSQSNLEDFLTAVPGVLEVSIGHALIAESIYAGLEATVRRYLEIIGSANRGR